MTDQLERELADLLATKADTTDPGPVPLAAIANAGREVVRRARARRGGVAALVAAAVIVAIAVPVALRRDHAGAPVTPTPPTPAPSPSMRLTGPPTLPYLAGHRLHVDGRVVATDVDELVSRGGTTYFNDTVGVWWHVVDGSPVKVGTAGNSQEPWTGWHELVLSPDGRTLVVLTDPTPTTTRLTAYDTSADREVSDIDLSVPFTNWTGGGLAISYLGIDDNGQVYWSQMPFAKGLDQMNTAWVWQPGRGAPVELGKPFSGTQPGEPQGAFDVTPAGPVVGGVLGRVVHGQWQQVRRLGVPEGGAVWSPSGATVGYLGSAPGFLSVDSGTKVAARAAGTTIDRWIGFESDTAVLGFGYPTRPDPSGFPVLLRCDVTTGACATLGRKPQSATEWQWATNGPSSAVATAPPSVASPTTPALGTEMPDLPYVENGTLYVDHKPVQGTFTGPSARTTRTSAWTRSSRTRPGPGVSPSAGWAPRRCASRRSTRPARSMRRCSSRASRRTDASPSDRAGSAWGQSG